MNNYGNEFLAHLPYLYDGNNNYGSSVFFRYKHRADAIDKKVGLKVGQNKNLLVKDYQQSMNKKNFKINNEDNIREITTFVKHTTSSGNVKYAADIGHDDTTMTLVNAGSVFNKHSYREMVSEYADNNVPKQKLDYWKSILNEYVEHVEVADYSSVINVNKKRRMSKLTPSNYNNSQYGQRRW